METPEDLGMGVVSEIKLKSGITMILTDHKFYQPVFAKIEAEYPAFGFRFSLSGHTKMRLKCMNEDLDFKRGESSIFYFPEMTGAAENKPDEPATRVLIQIEPSLFETFVEDELNCIPAGLRKPVEKGFGDPFNCTGKITPLTKSILMQIINCPYQGNIRKLFLEGKVMELIACTLDEFKLKESGYNGSVCLKSDDINKIREAGDFLERNFRKPPELNDLSRFVGFSRTKLLRCFSEIYGTTPAGFIRDTRLQKAKTLLEKGEMNVTDTAYFVGYSSLSHFSAIFRNYYGTSPRQFLQNHLG